MKSSLDCIDPWIDHSLQEHNDGQNQQSHEMFNVEQLHLQEQMQSIQISEQSSCPWSKKVAEQVVYNADGRVSSGH